MNKISAATAETLSALKLLGYKWTIEVKVDHRIELHNEVKTESGREFIQFIAELDGYGNVTAWGLFGHEARKIDRNKHVLNADGDVIND